MAEDPIILCDNLVKIYKTRDLEVLALQGLDLTVQRGEMLAIVGNSGSGKSTFLNMLGALDRPDAGRLLVDGKDLFKMSDRELVEYKRSTVGFVWQNNARNLLPWLPAWQNVETPMLFGSKRARSVRARELLDLVGMGDRADRKLDELSTGEQQRIAIAIALANSPKVLLADEPTGSVDSRTGGYILDVFRHLSRDLGVTVVIVTHDRALAKRVERVVSIRDGKIASEMVMTDRFSERLKNTEGFDDGVDSEETQQEFAVLDRAGRVQISQHLLDRAGIRGHRVRMSAEEDSIVIRSGEQSAQESGKTASAQ